MTRLRTIAPLLLCVLLGSAAAQFSGGNISTGTLHVRITFTNGRACNTRVRVQLMGGASNGSLAETFTNDTGTAEFNNIEVGTYHLVVSGQGIEETDSGSFEVDNRRGSQYQYVQVRKTSETAAGEHDSGGGQTVAAADLNIPPKAAKEFDKASKLIALQQWKKALTQLNRALAVYPQYAAAYNNMGVVYGRMGDRVAERTALQKAVSLNDHFVPAYVNLARMAITDHDFPAAEGLLDKATGMDPTNLLALVLLSNVELLDHHYDLAISNCRKVHSMGQDSHALVHYIAARAFEHQNRPADATTEFQTFLTEEPSGARADAVRKELASLSEVK